MSAGTHWLGDAELWGLTPRRFGEIRDELEDHVHCVSAREGEDRAKEQRTALATDKARRRLNAPHLADQVYATLNRWPTRREWLEFMWLGIWFALIVFSDWLSIHSGAQRGAYMKAQHGYAWVDSGDPMPAALINLATYAWLVQGVARAGFFASLIASLWRAYRTGWGVVIARILQLKLIHTVLVVTATMLLGRHLWNTYPYDFGMKTNWPTWLIAPTICGFIALAGIAIWLISRMRLWHYGLGAIICAGFLYPGGPYDYEYVRIQHPIAYKEITKPDGRKVLVPETDKAIISKWAKRVQEGKYGRNAVATESTNLMQDDDQGAVYMPLHVAMLHQLPWYRKPWRAQWESVTTVLSRTVETRTPLAYPGAGLGWLAAPIPLLGILGFLGLIIVMGRRGWFELFMYLALTFFAIGSTFMPFLFAQDVTKAIDFSPLGVVHTPFPGFESLLLGGDLGDNWLLIFGLVLSAAIPWLLTGLFLRPDRGKPRPAGPDLAEEEL